MIKAFLKFYSKQLTDILSNPKIIFKKIKIAIKLFKRLILLPVNFFLFLIIILTSNLKLIRVGKIKSKWVGEFVIRTEVYLQEKEVFNSKSLDFLIIDDFISNEFFLKKIKSKIKVYPSIFLDCLNLINYFSKQFPKLRMHLAMREDQQRDVNMLLDKKPVFFNLTEKEKIEGEKILEKFVKKKYKGIVLFCIRNADYNNKFFPEGNKNRSWNYLDYRNYSFDDFLASAEFLAKKNYLVLRMGKFNSEKIKIENENIIDYSNSKWKSDFMDFFLGYNCSFCITTYTGMDCFARLFRKPFGAIVNPIEDVFYFQKNWIHIFGLFKNLTDGKFLNLHDIFKNKLHQFDYFEKMNKFKLIKNNEEQILGLVKEVCARYENTFVQSNEVKIMENCFWREFRESDLIKKGKYFDKFDNSKIISANISSDLLEKNKFLLSY